MVLMQIIRKSVGTAWFSAIILFVVKPEWIAWAFFPLPTWARGVGFGVWAISMPILWWIEIALGKNLYTTLHLREQHTLVTSGPYRHIRQPMYAAHIPLILSWLPA